MFERFTIPALAFHLAIIVPAFQDLVPNTGNFTGILNEFTLMDNVATKAPIISIKRNKNILKRRDASCDLNYSKLMGTTNRIIATEELYAATQHCANGFYQDSLKDWRNGDPLFGNKILPWFQEAVITDVASNAYFGDTQRPETQIFDPIKNEMVPSEWSTTKYDGIFKWAIRFAEAGAIRPSQTFEMPNVDMRNNPSIAFAVIKNAYDRQPLMMRNLAPGEKAFYVDAPILDGYRDFLRGIGDESSFIVQSYANGVDISSYNRIPIYVDPIWEPILNEIYGENQHALILTVRGNMIFATDKAYGEGPNLDRALMVWYEDKDLSWYFQQFLKAGTGIAMPEFFVFALPA